MGLGMLVVTRGLVLCALVWAAATAAAAPLGGRPGCRSSPRGWRPRGPAGRRHRFDAVLVWGCAAVAAAVDLLAVGWSRCWSLLDAARGARSAAPGGARGAPPADPRRAAAGRRLPAGRLGARGRRRRPRPAPRCSPGCGSRSGWRSAPLARGARTVATGRCPSVGHRRGRSRWHPGDTLWDLAAGERPARRRRLARGLARGSTPSTAT